MIPAGQFFETRDGLRLFFRDFPPLRDGGKAPVVCLPGLTRNSDDFADIAEHMRAERRVLCLDLRGRGRSDFDPDYRNYRPQVYLDDVVEWLDWLQVSPVVALGTSLGGLLSMALAQRQISRLTGIVLNDIGPELAPAGLARIAAYVGKTAPPEDWAGAVRNVQLSYAHALPDFTAADWERMARRTYRIEADGRVVLRSDRAIGRALDEGIGGGAQDYWHLFRALAPLPVLLLRGALSDLLVPATVEKMKARKPDLKVLTVPGRGHVPQLDEPAVVAAIDAFLRRVA